MMEKKEKPEKPTSVSEVGLSDLLECTDDYHDDDEYCGRCNNTGVILICIDDICHGVGYCIHGDGEIVCPDCGGESAF